MGTDARETNNLLTLKTEANKPPSCTGRHRRPPQLLAQTSHPLPQAPPRLQPVEHQQHCQKLYSSRATRMNNTSEAAEPTCLALAEQQIFSATPLWPCSLPQSSMRPAILDDGVKAASVR